MLEVMNAKLDAAIRALDRLIAEQDERTDTPPVPTAETTSADTVPTRDA
jgi:hypothetical protein